MRVPVTSSTAGALCLRRQSAAASLRVPLRLTNRFAGLQTAHVDSPGHERPLHDVGARPYKGLDMEKVIDSAFIDPWQTHHRSYSGYLWGSIIGSFPSVKAMNVHELNKYYSLDKYWEHYTFKEIVHAMRGPALYALNFKSIFLWTVIYFFTPFIFLNLFEPMEFSMPEDEFFENVDWNELGAHLDHHAFAQYLEARRYRKWHDPDFDVVQYIPPEYRSRAQKEARGEWTEEDERRATLH